MSFDYTVYGLKLRSNSEISGPQPSDGKHDLPDIEITMGSIPAELWSHTESSTQRYYFDAGLSESDPPHIVVDTLSNGKYFHFCYYDEVDFIIDRDATAVWCKWEDKLAPDDAALYLLGPVLGFMLRLRGVTCLHAGGIVINDSALAIVGPSGAGKSTLTASFGAAGYPVLTDDVMPLELSDGEALAVPGYARLRLFPNSFYNLEELPDNLPQLTPAWDKCYLDLHAHDYKFQTRAVSLKVIYIYDWSKKDNKDISFATIPPSTAIPALAANTYRNELLDAEMRKQEFYFLSRLASVVKVKRVCPVSDISSIPELRDAIINDFSTETGSDTDDSRQPATSPAHPA